MRCKAFCNNLFSQTQHIAQFNHCLIPFSLGFTNVGQHHVSDILHIGRILTYFVLENSVA